jgi:hypothetical protein
VLHGIGNLVYEGLVVPVIGASNGRRALARPVTRRDGQHV